MHADLSFYHLLTDASLLVQLVLLLLLVVSLVSWTMIVSNWKTVTQSRREADHFEDQFWSGSDLGVLYDRLRSKEDPSGMEQIFVAGFRDYVRLHRHGGLTSSSIADTALRSMRVALSREVDSLETNQSFLATVGSTSPYVGLFGTVWGIMSAFLALGDVQQATLALVAPGIAEALIATAMGLFAAIPAVVAYNRYSNDIDRLVSRYENFMEEFAALLQRQVLMSEPSTPARERESVLG